MKSRFQLLVAEAVHSIRTNLSTTVAATMTVFIGMFLLGICIALGSWMVSWSNHNKKEIAVHVFFCVPETCENRVTNEQKDLAAQRIKELQDQGMVKSYTYVSKEDAFREESKKNPEMYSALSGVNPLPDAFDIAPTRAEDASKVAKALQSPPLAGVEKVRYGGKVTERVLAVAKVIEFSFLVMVMVLLVASTALIANTIRLSIFARRREIEVMKLVGASNWFVRGPFLLEGLICGLGGAFFAVILLSAAKVVAMPALDLDINAGTDVHAWPFAVTSLLMLLVGLVLGAIGTSITLRRFLQV